MAAVTPPRARDVEDALRVRLRTVEGVRVPDDEVRGSSPLGRPTPALTRLERKLTRDVRGMRDVSVASGIPQHRLKAVENDL